MEHARGKRPGQERPNPGGLERQKRAHKDVDARWTQKNAQSFYGYKDPIKVNIQTKPTRIGGRDERPRP
jgi:hypothetical protein